MIISKFGILKNQCRPKTINRTFCTFESKSSDSFQIPESEFIPTISQNGYTSRHVISIFPTLPVLDKLQEIQKKFAAKTRVKTVPRDNLQIVLVPLGTSLSDPSNLSLVKRVMDNVAQSSSSIHLEIGGIGCLPKWTKPREIWAGLLEGKDEVKQIIKKMEVEFSKANLPLNEPLGVPHRTRIPLGAWEDVYVTNVQGDLAKEISDSLGMIPQASFTANQMILLEMRPDMSYIPIHISAFGNTHPGKKRARYKTLL